MADYHNRGSALSRLVETTLNDIKRTAGINSLNKIDKKVLSKWIENLRERVSKRELSTSTTRNRIMAWNRVAEAIERDDLKLSAKEYALSRGHIEYENRANPPGSREAFLKWLDLRYKSTGDVRFKALQHAVKLQRYYGLRFRESVRICVREKDPDKGFIKLSKHDGTKNGRPREIRIMNKEQYLSLKEAKEFTETQRWKSLIPRDLKYKQFKDFAYNTKREFEEETGIKFDFHGERHIFAKSRVMELTREMDSKSMNESFEEDTRTEGISNELPEVACHRDGQDVHSFNPDDLPELPDDKAIVEKYYETYGDPQEIPEDILETTFEELGHSPRIDITMPYLK